MNDVLKNSLNRRFNKQQPAHTPAYVPAAEVIDRFSGKWREHVPAAKYTWGLLGENELVRSEGRRENLAWLIQGRYTMSPSDANHQIDNFMQERGV